MTKVRILTILSFGAIYLIWGSTYFAIRVAVESVPPLLAAGVRFFIAGAVLYAWARWRRDSAPSPAEWRSVFKLSVLLFLIAYGGVFWAERSVPSGIVAVLVSTIPLWTALLQIFIFKKETLRWSLPVGIMLGLTGVAMLAFDPVASLNLLACAALVLSQISWSTGTALSKILPVPSSMAMNSGAQMLLGGVLLLASSALVGEWRPVPHISLRAWLAILYLAVAGSIAAFTAYVWLLARMKATVVTSYAYVNPVVALLVGHWLGHEGLSARTVLGAALVLVSVVVVIWGEKH